MSHLNNWRNIFVSQDLRDLYNYITVSWVMTNKTFNFPFEWYKIHANKPRAWKNRHHDLEHARRNKIISSIKISKSTYIVIVIHTKNIFFYDFNLTQKSNCLLSYENYDAWNNLCKLKLASIRIHKTYFFLVIKLVCTQDCTKNVLNMINFLF